MEGLSGVANAAVSPTLVLLTPDNAEEISVEAAPNDRAFPFLLNRARRQRPVRFARQAAILAAPGARVRPQAASRRPFFPPGRRVGLTSAPR